MKIDLIAGYLVGKLDKKFDDKDNSHTGDIIIPVRFIDPYERKFYYNNKDNEHIVLPDYEYKLKVALPLIQSTVDYLFSLGYADHYCNGRYVKLWPSVNRTDYQGLPYLAMNYEIGTYDMPDENRSMTEDA